MVHAGLPHWMNLADGVAVPFMQDYTRNPFPERVVWEQHSKTHSRFYWLAVDEAQRQAGTRVIVSYAGQTVDVEEASGLQSLRIRISDAMLDMDQPMSVTRNGATLFEGTVARTIAVIAATLETREDPSMVYAGEVVVDL